MLDLSTLTIIELERMSIAQLEVMLLDPMPMEAFNIAAQQSWPAGAVAGQVFAAGAIASEVKA